jgi:galactosylxylosylprotein 3-beta-galactosyltransferase
MVPSPNRFFCSRPSYYTGNNNPNWDGKWGEKEWWACDYYIPYAVGGGYIVSTTLVVQLGGRHQLWKAYKSEDVALGLWLAPFAIERRHDVRFVLDI